MFYHGRVELRKYEGKWFATLLDNHDQPVLTGGQGWSSPGSSVDRLFNEIEDWQSYKETRYPS